MVYINIITHFVDIPKLNVKYHATHKVQMHADTISKLLYGFASVRAIIQSLKLLPYKNFHIVFLMLC